MSGHIEFPELTPVARAAHQAGCLAADCAAIPQTNSDRRYLSAFLRETMKQATEHDCILVASRLEAIAANLHSPPPPPPTLAQAREAARQLAGADAEIVHAFLATLGEGVQQP